MERRKYPSTRRPVLDDSKVPVPRGFHGLERTVRALTGARGVWVVHPPGQVIGEHSHDWPYLMLPALGDYVERDDAGEARITGPATVLHPAGACHANCIGMHGMEGLSIEFDPAWAKLSGLALASRGSCTWVGGAVASSARSLAAQWRDPLCPDADVAKATALFLRFAFGHEKRTPPEWLGDVQALLDGELPPTTAEIARRLDLHPAWLAHSYRQATGEGLHETLRRKRLERAALLLRNTDAPPADIALATGFCDQSHMIRGFRAVLGRTPLEVRAEREFLSRFS